MFSRYIGKEQTEAMVKVLQDTRGIKGIYGEFGLLYIEPATKAEDTPVIDELTRKMTAAFRSAEPFPYGFAGVHDCICGALSCAHDYVLPNGLITNSLCIHYLAFHRGAIPLEEIRKVQDLDSGEEEPSIQELKYPKR